MHIRCRCYSHHSQLVIIRVKWNIQGLAQVPAISLSMTFLNQRYINSVDLNKEK